VLLIWRFPVSRRQYVDAWSQAIADGSVTQCERAPASVSGDLDAITVVLTRTLTRGPHYNDLFSAESGVSMKCAYVVFCCVVSVRWSAV